MSEKIVQLNEEVIKGQLKELVRGSVEAVSYTHLVAECRRFLTEHPDGPEITFVCFSSHMAAIYRQLLDQETEQM